MKKCVNTCGDDEPCQKPSFCGMAFLCGRVKFHRHPEKSCNRFPPFVGWRAIEIRAARFLAALLNFSPCNTPARLLGELRNLRQCNRLARFLRQDNLRFCFRQRSRLQRLCFAGIEPDEFANSTDFDLDSAAAVEGDCDGRAVGLHLLRRANDAVTGTQFRQWNSTSRAKKFSVYAGMMSQTRRAVDRAARGASSARLPL